MTGAIKNALKERQEREKRERSLGARIQDLHASGQRCVRPCCETGLQPLSTEPVYVTNMGCPSDSRYICSLGGPIWASPTPNSTKGQLRLLPAFACRVPVFWRLQSSSRAA